MLTSRKKRPLNRQEAVRDAKLIVIATEGERTEKVYFEAFGNSRVQMVIIPSSKGKSSPRQILANLQQYKDDYQIFLDDELWLVIDKDRWPLKQLHEVNALAKDAGFGLALSNPAFEIWLAYHFEAQLPKDLTSTALVKHLKVVSGAFSKTRYDAQIYVPRTHSAAARAMKDDNDPKSPWPEPFGSRVYKIVAGIQ